MFQVPLGIFKNPAMPYMRVGSYLPITVVLALVFVIPHGGLREGVIIRGVHAHTHPPHLETIDPMAVSYTHLTLPTTAIV